MADYMRRLYGPALLGTAPATIYTVPNGAVVSIRQIHVFNVSPTIAAAFTLSIGADAVGTRLYSAVLIPAGGSLDWNGIQVVNASEIIQAYASVANLLTLTISGVETS